MSPRPPRRDRLHLRARLRRWWHCLIHGHQTLTVRADGRVIVIGCACGFMAWVCETAYNTLVQRYWEECTKRQTAYNATFQRDLEQYSKRQP